MHLVGARRAQGRPSAGGRPARARPSPTPGRWALAGGRIARRARRSRPARPPSSSDLGADRPAQRASRRGRGRAALRGVAAAAAAGGAGCTRRAPSAGRPARPNLISAARPKAVSSKVVRAVSISNQDCTSPVASSDDHATRRPTGEKRASVAASRRVRSGGSSGAWRARQHEQQRRQPADPDAHREHVEDVGRDQHRGRALQAARARQSAGEITRKPSGSASSASADAPEPRGGASPVAPTDAGRSTGRRAADSVPSSTAPKPEPDQHPDAPDRAEARVQHVLDDLAVERRPEGDARRPWRPGARCPATPLTTPAITASSSTVRAPARERAPRPRATARSRRPTPRERRQPDRRAGRRSVPTASAIERVLRRRAPRRTRPASRRRRCPAARAARDTVAPVAVAFP